MSTEDGGAVSQPGEPGVTPASQAPDSPAGFPGRAWTRPRGTGTPG